MDSRPGLIIYVTSHPYWLSYINNSFGYIFYLKTKKVILGLLDFNEEVQFVVCQYLDYFNVFGKYAAHIDEYTWWV